MFTCMINHCSDSIESFTLKTCLSSSLLLNRWNNVLDNKRTEVKHSKDANILPEYFLYYAGVVIHCTTNKKVARVGPN